MIAIYDLDDGWDETHDDWHSHEHMHERVRIPGFLRGRRYVADRDAKRCFVLYEADSLDVLTSQAYLECLNNPTPLSLETMPHFRNMTRTLSRVTVSVGRGLGGKMAYIPLSPESSRVSEFRNGIEKILEGLVKQPGTLAAHLLEADGEASRIQTKEKELRGDSDSVADWLLIVEGYRPQTCVFETGPLTKNALSSMGAASVGNVSSYAFGALLDESEVA
jgi:hypothetical protein